LVAAIIAMAGALHLTTVAEGVETVAQANALRRLGVQRAQGYLYSCPLPADVVPAIFERLGGPSPTDPAGLPADHSATLRANSAGVDTASPAAPADL
jgi:predicted signal transduction protein with EAL and GGDEF domain